MGPRRRSKGDPRKAVGLLRVSTDEQSLGPEAQRATLIAWCRSHDVELVQVHEDLGVSGAAPLDKRLGLLAAVASLQAHGAGLLLVAKRDRLARDVVLAAMAEKLVERAGAIVVAADGTGNGDAPEALLMRRIIDSFSEYERGLIRARTKAALGVKRTRRERVGSIPYGYRLAEDGVHLVEDEAEQRVVRAVRELRAARLSYRAISGELAAAGYLPRGKAWHPMTIRNIFEAAGSAV